MQRKNGSTTILPRANNSFLSASGFGNRNGVIHMENQKESNVGVHEETNGLSSKENSVTDSTSVVNKENKEESKVGYKVTKVINAFSIQENSANTDSTNPFHH
jgi:hypothetical protein